MGKCLPSIRKNSNLGKQLGLSKDIRYNTIAEIRELINKSNISQITLQQKQQALQLYSEYLEQGGSNQDIDGFKEFTKSGKQIEKSVSLQDKVNTLIEEGKATKFCK